MARRRIILPRVITGKQEDHFGLEAIRQSRSSRPRGGDETEDLALVVVLFLPRLRGVSIRYARPGVRLAVNQFGWSGRPRGTPYE